MKRARSFLVAALLLGVLASCAQTIADKKVVQMKYKGYLADGTLIASSDDAGGPLEYMIGTGTMNPSIEIAIMGMKAGDTKKIEVKAADAFGEYDKNNIREVPKEYLPSDATPGMELTFDTESGTMSAKVVEVKSKSAMVDFNHPLAGKDLTFEVEIISIRDPTRDELQKALTSSGAARVQ